MSPKARKASTSSTAAEPRPLPPDLVLLKGLHSDDEFGRAMCVMEAVAYVAGEPHSDHPKCACPVITAFLISWNDSIPNDAHRTALLAPLVERLVGTKSTKAVERMRADLAFDWFVRVQTPTWMDLSPSCRDAAAELRKLVPLNAAARFSAAQPSLIVAREESRRASAAAESKWDAAWDAAWAAAWAAAWDAARAAAWAAARAAAWDAAWAAAWAAAWDAAWAAAWDAAWDAAWAAAWDAAWDEVKSKVDAALRPSVAALEISALELVDRMIAVTPETTPEQLDALCAWTPVSVAPPEASDAH